MKAKAGDPCCFCGAKLVSDGDRVFCVSREDGDLVCVGAIKPQEEQPADIETYRAIGRAILANLEDRRDIKTAFRWLKTSSRFIYDRLEWEIGEVATRAVAREKGDDE